MFIKNIILGFSVLLATLHLSACATLVSGTSDTISINSNISGADVFINGQLRGKTPLTLQLKRKKGSSVAVRKEGYHPQEQVLTTSLPTAFWGNIITGGLTGSTTDLTSGAVYEYSPSSYFFHLEPDNASEPEKKASTKKEAARKFILINYDSLVGEISKGTGEYLDALHTLLQEQQEMSKEAMIKILQEIKASTKGPLSFAKKFVDNLF